MADYEPPNLADLLASVARDLVDPEGKVWGVEQLTDYINGGIGELNRIAPLESVEYVVWDEETETLPLATLVLDSVFQVELRSPTGNNQRLIPFATSGVSVRDGWDYHAHTLWLGPSWAARSARYARDEGWNLVLWGYRSRDPLLDAADVAEFLTLTDEMFVRLYCKVEAYRALNMDRSLFQQWQQQANNSDISATQLNGMLGTAEGAFDRQQRRNLSPRRIPAV
jgi:hypothetical protein